MQELIERVFTDPTFVWVGLVVAVILLLAIFKKLFKLVMVIVAAFILYVGYLYYTNEKAVEEFIDKGKEVIKDVKDMDLKDLKDGAERAIKDTKKNLKKKIK